MVVVPESLAFIDRDAFGGSSERLVLEGALNSPAAGIAAEAGFHFAHIETEDNETGVTLLKYETMQNAARIPDFIDGKPVTQIGAGVEKQSVFSSDIDSVILPSHKNRIFEHLNYLTDEAWKQIGFMPSITIDEALKEIVPL